MAALPFVLAASALAGVGMAAYGAVESNAAQKEQSKYQQDMIAREQEAEAQRKKAMELDARRRSLEVLRNSQRARALALSTATNQGAGQSSGLQGGYGQIAGDAGNQAMGIAQNLEIGRSLFGINQGLSSARMGYADAGSRLATAQGFSSFGGTLISSSSMLNSLSQGFGGSSNQGGGFGGRSAYNPMRIGSLY